MDAFKREQGLAELRSEIVLGRPQLAKIFGVRAVQDGQPVPQIV